MHSAGMELRTWLTAENIAGYAFARKIGKSHTTVSRWLDGTMVPSAESIKLVFEATGGKVTANDMLGQG